jgi:hypothetical protein
MRQSAAANGDRCAILISLRFTKLLPWRPHDRHRWQTTAASSALDKTLQKFVIRVQRIADSHQLLQIPTGDGEPKKTKSYGQAIDDTGHIPYRMFSFQNYRDPVFRLIPLREAGLPEIRDRAEGRKQSSAIQQQRTERL